MRQQICVIKENIKLTNDICKMIISCDTGEIRAPGQFVNIQIDNCYLRRPISICDYDDDNLTLIYKVVGKGTAILSEMKEGEVLDVLLPLGNGYNVDSIPDNPVIVGGGVGIPPMYGLAKAIKEKNPQVFLGFNNEKDVFLVDEFKQLGIDVKTKIGGFVTEILPKDKYYCACGPEVMLKAVDGFAYDGQYSFEGRMACGFGACKGCSCKTKYGDKRICKEGPVLTKGEIIW